MAKQDNLFFIGRIGNVIGSTWKGIPYLRYEPDHQNQSEGTQKSAATLGFCSAIGAALRQAVLPALQPLGSRKMENDFTGVLYKWMKSHPFTTGYYGGQTTLLMGYQFNPETSLPGRCRVPVAITSAPSGYPVVSVAGFEPAQYITAPAGTAAVQVSVAVGTYDINNRCIAGSDGLQQMVAYTDEPVAAQQFALSYRPPLHSLTLVVMGVRYVTYRNSEPVFAGGVRWQPAGIVAVLVQ